MLEGSCPGTITKAPCSPIFILFPFGFCILFCWLNLNIKKHHVIVEPEIVFMLPLFGLCSGFFVSVLYQICNIWRYYLHSYFGPHFEISIHWLSSSLVTHEVKLHLLTSDLCLCLVSMVVIFAVIFLCSLTIHGVHQVVHFHLGLL